VSLKVIPLLQAFSSATFRSCGASRGPSASAELLVRIDDVIMVISFQTGPSGTGPSGTGRVARLVWWVHNACRWQVGRQTFTMTKRTSTDWRPSDVVLATSVRRCGAATRILLRDVTVHHPSAFHALLSSSRSLFSVETHPYRVDWRHITARHVMLHRLLSERIAYAAAAADAYRPLQQVTWPCRPSGGTPPPT